MGLIILDTCIFLRSVTPFEVHHDKAKQIVLRDEWLTSSIVYDELKKLAPRRARIYTNIMEFTYNSSQKITFLNVYSRYFKSTAYGNQNDEVHVRNLFQNCLEKADISENAEVNEELWVLFTETLSQEILSIRVGLRKILTQLKDPICYRQHIIASNWDKTSVKSLKKDLFSISDWRDNKEDLKIVLDAVAYAMDILGHVCLLSSDGLLSNSKVAKEITFKIRRLQVDNMEIQNLESYKMT